MVSTKFKLGLLSVVFLVVCVLIGIAIYCLIPLWDRDGVSHPFRDPQEKRRYLREVLSTELFLIADGSHFLFPLSTKNGSEEKHKTVAIAVSKLLTNLRTMLQTDRLLKNKIVSTEEFRQNYATIEKKANHFELSSEDFLRTTLDQYFRVVDGVFSNDTKLGIDYKKQIIEAEEVVRKNPKVRGSTFKYMKMEELRDVIRASFFEDKIIYRQLETNNMFLIYVSINEGPPKLRNLLDDDILVRALLQAAASTAYEAKVNEVYQRALVKSGQVSLSTDERAIFKRDEMKSVLFATIEEGLELEPELQKYIQDVMEQIRTQIASLPAYLP